jgi:peptidoglycan hydrolase-like protein with peptidoglycan-binding domain
MMRRLVTWVGVPVLVITAGAVGTGWTLTRDDGEAAEATDEIGGTAEITRGTVIQTETYAGSIGYAEARPVVNQRMGTLTRVPETGAVIRRGDVLYRVDDEPVVLLIGELPLYRELSEGAEGKDVRQLEQNLRALGYADAITVDDEFTEGTGEAVEEFREGHGLSDAESVAVGDVVFQPTPVRVSGAAVEVGSPVQPGSSPVEVTSTAKQVTATLDSIDDTTEGAEVTVELPDGTRTKGTVESLEESASPSAETGETTATAEITLSDQRAAAEWETGDVDVDVEIARATDVLVTPVTALVALAEGGYAVRVVDDTAESGYRLVAVQPGLFADERVEVSGQGLKAGMTVVVPSA